MPETAAIPAVGALAQITRLSAHVLSVEAHTTPNSSCSAAVRLSGGSQHQQLFTVGLFTSETRLQSLLETALATGYLIDFEGRERPGESQQVGLPKLPSAFEGLFIGYDITRVNVHNHP